MDTEQFEAIFYPRSVAVVGASPDKNRPGYGWVKAKLAVGFKGKIFPVNPNYSEILGLKCYPRLLDIPEPVDYVNVSRPRESVLQLLDDCARKAVKAVHFFTAGFGELDTPGKELEREMVKKARQGGFRIIGPNCLGSYCTEINLPIGPLGVVGKAGKVSFVSQSGGLAADIVVSGTASGLGFSKGVSFGNGIDLESSDFLEYYTADPGTGIIGGYLEGVHDGPRFLRTLSRAAAAKPVVVWKGGRTRAGSKAACSHTGSLAGPAAIWSAALKQAGVVEAHSLEELLDTLVLFQQVDPPPAGARVSFVSGAAGGAGGASVAAADACDEAGIEMPLLAEETQRGLADVLGRVGSILHNPVDMSQSYGDLAKIRKAIALVAADPAVDLLIVQEDIASGRASRMSEEILSELIGIFVGLKKDQPKPVVVVSPSGTELLKQQEINRTIREAGIAVFPTVQRAARAIANVDRYFKLKRREDSLS